LRAAIEAARLTAHCARVTLFTDSTYVRSGITKWLAGWKRNGWRTATGRPVENQAFWLELDALADERLTWEWTRAHVGTPGNERCLGSTAGRAGVPVGHDGRFSCHPCPRSHPERSEGSSRHGPISGCGAVHRDPSLRLG